MSAQGKDLLVAALAQIETQPETWNQKTWECGTAACLAGHMARLDPDVVAVGIHADGYGLGVALSDRRFVNYGQYVRERLNIGAFDQIDLTAANNTLDDLRAGVKAVLNGESVCDAIERDRAERAS